MAEWDFENNVGLDPDDFTGGSDQQIQWKCLLGHTWRTAIKSRVIGGTNCPYCEGKKAWPGFNDLATLEPLIAGEWDYEANKGLLPEQFTRCSNEIVWWKCGFGHGHSYPMMINNRSGRGQQCPYCHGHKVLTGYNDLVTIQAPFLGEWDYEKNVDIRPTQFSKGAHDIVWWKCEKYGHSWDAAIYSRWKNGCPYCGGRKYIPGVSDLATVNPAVAGEWNYEANAPLRPDQVSANNPIKVWWRCEKGHSWPASVINRNHGSRCPYCTNRLALKGFNDLLTIVPEMCWSWADKENAPLMPYDVTPGSGRRVWWKCKLGHLWKAAVSYRVRGTGCPVCANKVVLAGYNDLNTLRPDIAADWDKEQNGLLRPDQVTVQSTAEVWWKCVLHGHSYMTRVYHRYNGTGCPYCSGNRPIVGENDLATVHPELALQWDDEKNEELRPEDVTCGSTRKVWWKCLKHRRSYQASVVSRTTGNTDCPRCKGKSQMRTRLVK